MSDADTPYDSQYHDKAKYLNLEAEAQPLLDSEQAELRNLLHLVKMILNKTTLSISDLKEEANLEKVTPRTDPDNRVRGAMQRYASSIAQQITLPDGKTEDNITWQILGKDPAYPLKSKAILSLVAFATMFGKVRLAVLFDKSNSLAKSIMLLKQTPKIQAEKEHDELTSWFQTLTRVINLTLKLADGVMDLKDTDQPFSSKKEKMAKPLLSTSVFRVINVVVTCWSQVDNIFIKHSSGNIYVNLSSLQNLEGALIRKCDEIEKLTKISGKKALAVVKGPPETGSSTSSSNLCWNLCQWVNPTTAVKPPKRTLLSFNNTTPSLSDRRLLTASTQEILDKDALRGSSGTN